MTNKPDKYTDPESFNWQGYCGHCGRMYGSTRSDSLYCSPACRQAAHRTSTASTATPTAICQNCGAEFPAKRTDARYCSDRCRKQFDRSLVKRVSLRHRPD